MFVYHFTVSVKEITFIAISPKVPYDKAVKWRKRFSAGGSARQKGRIIMAEKLARPLLLLDNSNMMSVLNKGEFKCTNLSFEEARAIIDMYDEQEVLRCFTDTDIETVIFDYLGVTKRNFQNKKIRNMREGQDAIIFKLYITPSETQPVVETPEGVEAKKIQNVYVYCQHLIRVK